MLGKRLREDMKRTAGYKVIRQKTIHIQSEGKNRNKNKNKNKNRKQEQETRTRKPC